MGSLVACVSLGEFASDDPKLQVAPGRFSGRFVAISDVDMAATAYADGKLEPLIGARDVATLFDGGKASATGVMSNSVVSWPQIADVSPDGQLVFVAETRGPSPAGAARLDNVFEDFPAGTRVTAARVDGDTLTVTGVADEVGINLQSLEAASNGRFLAIASETQGAELVVLPTGQEGTFEAPRRFALNPPYADDDAERRVRALHIAPDSRLIGVNVANRRIQFYRLALDDQGVPVSVEPYGAPSPDIGKRIAVSKWSKDGRYLLVTDTNWSDSAVSMLFVGPSTISVIAPPIDAASAPRVVSRARVGRGAEGFSISPDGRNVASINMERTFLPELPFLTAWPGRRLYSVSLLSFDQETGALKETSRARQAGLLPEDVIFDTSNQNLAVAVFHRRKGEARRSGFIDFFEIKDNVIISQGTTQPVARGVHDLVALPN